MIHERVIKSEFSHFQTLGSKCLLCPYVTFDISVLGALLIFVIYGAFKHIDVLDRNGSFFLLIKLYPSSMTLAHYRSLVEWNLICVINVLVERLNFKQNKK